MPSIISYLQTVSIQIYPEINLSNWEDNMSYVESGAVTTSKASDESKLLKYSQKSG